jgi:hypothetical protein
MLSWECLLACMEVPHALRLCMPAWESMHACMGVPQCLPLHAIFTDSVIFSTSIYLFLLLSQHFACSDFLQMISDFMPSCGFVFPRS